MLINHVLLINHWELNWLLVTLSTLFFHTINTTHSFLLSSQPNQFIHHFHNYHSFITQQCLILKDHLEAPCMELLEENKPSFHPLLPQWFQLTPLPTLHYQLI